MSEIDLLQRIRAIEATVKDLLRREYTKSGEWVDYSATSTVTGWSSFTTKKIWCKLSGNRLDVEYTIVGVSDQTYARFTLPYSKANPTNAANLNAVGIAADNGGANAFGHVNMAAGANLVSCYLDAGTGAFTASGTKTVTGEFWIIIA